jgi:excisionase family DNA binding protein
MTLYGRPVGEAYVTRQRLTVQEAAEVLGTSVDAVRMRVRRGSLDSARGDDGRVYVWVNVDESETKHEPNGESTALVSAKDETIRVLTEQLQAERQAHAEARRLLAAALERIPPQLEAPQEPSGGPESAVVGQEGAQPRSSTTRPEEPADALGGPRSGTARGSWWRRMFGG